MIYSLGLLQNHGIKKFGMQDMQVTEIG